MKYQGVFKVETTRPDIVEKSYLKYEKDCSTVKSDENSVTVIVQEDDERLFKKTLTSTMEKVILSANTIEFCIKNDSEGDD